MNRRSPRASHLLVAALALAACNSLVDDPCAAHFTYTGGICVDTSDPGGGPDAGLLGDAGPRGDGGPAGDAGSAIAIDAGSCSMDLQTDPNNCGHCGVVCASGVCSAGVCTGAPDGHVIVIGHDYTSYDEAMGQVLGNSAGLGRHPDVAVATWIGTASEAAVAGADRALRSSMSHDGRTYHAVPISSPPTTAQLDAADVVLIDAQQGDPNEVAFEAAPWQAPLATFIAAGGVVIVLEGANGTSYAFGSAAGLYDAGPPTTATGELATVVVASDATTTNVVSPYLAESTSIAYATTAGATITCAAGAVVLDLVAPPP